MRLVLSLLLVWAMVIHLGCSGSVGGGGGIRNISIEDYPPPETNQTGGNVFDDENLPTPSAPAPAVAEQQPADAAPAQANAQQLVQATPSNAFDDEAPPPTAAPSNAFDDEQMPATGAGINKGQAAAPSNAFDDEAPPPSSAPSNAFDDEATSTPVGPPPTHPTRPPTRSGKGAIMQGGNPLAGDEADYAGAPPAAAAEPAADADAAATPVNLINKAAHAFEQFKEWDGSQYLYAHWLTQTESVNDYPIGWVAGLSEPRIFVRWGVGVVYDAPEGFTGQPPLIGGAPTVPFEKGDVARQPIGGTGRGVLAPKGTRRGNATAQNSDDPHAYAGFENLDRVIPMGDFIFHTGDFGERLIKRLDSRRLHSDAYYGKLLTHSDLGLWNYHRGLRVTDHSTQTATQPARRNPAPQPDSAGANAFDDEFSPNPTPVTGQPTGNSADPGEIDGTLIPGVTYLGTVDKSSGTAALIEKANELNLDGLLVFEVNVHERSRAKLVYSTTNLTVVNLKKPDDKTQTGSLNSESIARAREKGVDEANDPVELALDKIFQEFSDDRLRLSDMPELKPEIVAKRVESLASQTHPNPLPVIAEIVTYYRGGLLEEPAAVDAVGKILGDTDGAAKLLTGSPEERLVALEKWMPGNFKPATVTSDTDFR